MENIDKHSVLVHFCKEKAFHAFGFDYLFDKRAQSLGRLINLLKYLGILLPSAFGLLILSYRFNPAALNLMIAIVSAISIILFCLSLYVAIYKLDDELPYSFESSQHHSSIYSRFKRLECFPPSDVTELRHCYELLEAETIARNQQDTKHNIKEWERRRAMRFSLREHQRECAGCKKTPLSMESTNCGVCGKFSFKYKYFIS